MKYSEIEPLPRLLGCRQLDSRGCFDSAQHETGRFRSDTK